MLVLITLKLFTLILLLTNNKTSHFFRIIDFNSNIKAY